MLLGQVFGAKTLHNYRNRKINEKVNLRVSLWRGGGGRGFTLWKADISDFEFVERAVTRRSLAWDCTPPSAVCWTVSPKPTNLVGV